MNRCKHPKLPPVAGAATGRTPSKRKIVRAGQASSSRGFDLAAGRVPTYRPGKRQGAPAPDTRVVVLSNGKTYRVLSTRAAKFIALMEGKAKSVARSQCRNQWDANPAGEGR